MPDEQRDVVTLDKSFRDLVNQNAEQAWLEYCKQHGLDPNAADDEPLNHNDKK